MASAMVEIPPSSELMLTKVEEQQNMSIDELCMSVGSISLTETSVKKVMEQIVKESTITEHHVVGSEDEDGSTGMDKQLPKQDGKVDASPVVAIPVENQTEEAQAAEEERNGEAKIRDELRTKHDKDKDQLSAMYADNDARIGSREQNDCVIESAEPRQRIPQEHDERIDALVDETKANDETVNNIVPRGPQGGIPVLPQYSPPQAVSQHYMQVPGLSPQYSQPQAMSPEYIQVQGVSPQYSQPQAIPQQYVQLQGVSPQYSQLQAISPLYSQPQAQVYSDCGGGLVDSYENAAKYRKPLQPIPDYVPPTTMFQPPDSALRTLSGGEVFDKDWSFGESMRFNGVLQPSQPVGSRADSNDINNFISECLQTQENSSIMSSGDFDAILNSVNADARLENPPMPAEMPPNTLIGIPDYLFAGFPTTSSPSRSPGSPAHDVYSDCISPGFSLSPGNTSAASVLSPTSTTDSGLDEELDFVNDFVEEEMRKDETNRNHRARSISQTDDYGLVDQFSPGVSDLLGPSVTQHLIGGPRVEKSNAGNPDFETPRVRNPSDPRVQIPAPYSVAEMNIQNPAVTGISPWSPGMFFVTTTAGQESTPSPGSLIFISPASQPVKATAAPSRKTGLQHILPKPPNYPPNYSQISTNTGLLMFFV